MYDALDFPIVFISLHIYVCQIYSSSLSFFFLILKFWRICIRGDKHTNRRKKEKKTTHKFLFMLLHYSLSLTVYNNNKVLWFHWVNISIHLAKFNNLNLPCPFYLYGSMDGKCKQNEIGSFFFVEKTTIQIKKNCTNARIEH